MRDIREYTSGRRTGVWRWNGGWRCVRVGGGNWTLRVPEAVAEKSKASVRAKVEHPFLKVKRLFGYWKVRYRGLVKNTERLALLFGLGNLLTAEGQLAS